MRGPRALIIELTPDEKAYLERNVRTRTLPHRDVVKAKIILLAASGASNAGIARRLEIHEHTVRKWRKRFLKYRLNGLRELPRAGVPSAFSPSGETQDYRADSEASPRSGASV